MRRTWTIDTTFPDGLAGRRVMEVRGRDLFTGATGTQEIVDEIAFTLDIDPWSAEIVGIHVQRAASPVDALLGAFVRSGFGRVLAERFAKEAEQRTLRYSALEDLGGAHNSTLRTFADVRSLAVHLR
jgi:hypothetical protein